MLAICVNCENHKVTEPLKLKSLSWLPILNETLLDFQIKCFGGLKIDEICLVGETDGDVASKDETPIVKKTSIGDLYKELLKQNDTETVFFFRSDFYFDCSFKEIYELHINSDNDITFIKYKDEEKIFGAFYSVGIAKREIAVLRDIKELFKPTLSNNIICINGYVKEILSIKSYKDVLFDLINLKTPYKPTFVAEGVFTPIKIPQGDFVIIPPVWFGDGVQIESGTVIGPNVVIMNDTLVSKNTRIKNSLLMNDVYVSSECYVDGVICCSGAVIKRGAAVFENSVLGSGCVIGEDSVIETESVVRCDVHINNYLKSPFANGFYEYNSLGGFEGLTPEKASLLGASIGYVYNKPKVCIGSDGEPNSQALRFSLIGGLISTGAEVVDIGNGYESFVFFCAKYCELDMSIYVSGRGGGTKIDVYENCVKPIGKSGYYNILCAVKNGDVPRCKGYECKSVRQIKGLAKMYVREITELFPKGLSIGADIKCENEYISAFISEVFKKTEQTYEECDAIHFKVNYKGDKVVAESKGVSFSHRELMSVALLFEKTNDRGDKEISFLDDLWRYDGVFLAFKILSLLNDTQRNLSEILGDVPRFYIEEKTLETSMKPGVVAEKIENIYFNKNDAFSLNNADIEMKKTGKSNELKITARALSVEFAKELIDEVEHILKT